MDNRAILEGYAQNRKRCCVFIILFGYIFILTISIWHYIFSRGKRKKLNKVVPILVKQSDTYIKEFEFGKRRSYFR